MGARAACWTARAFLAVHERGGRADMHALRRRARRASLSRALPAASKLQTYGAMMTLRRIRRRDFSLAAAPTPGARP